ncbi:major tail tube protein [Pseudomonas sp. EGD-AK9]|uniref:phage major tail tube protein n=1 Tax=Pseudomonas sp. EGD-AK9 TaxID=1386078 RepID=UPI000396D32A|nr:phage major tail tube protein [Pseudomonas sp. EGD-AK9]ERI50491.1 major tail tube protein [Pseudomonas sp. EGD-AK9]
MAMPRKLKNMNMFNDANSYQGVAKTVTLPDLARKMEAWRGAGMDGPVKVDLGHSDDGLQIEWTIGGLDLISIRQFGITNASGVGLRWSGAYQRDDDGTVISVEVIARGRHETYSFGDGETGEETEHTITTTCTYYKLIVEGNVEVEIDLLGMVFMVGDVDRLAEQRKAIGL